MKFSIILPTFNSGKYIKSCLDSIKKVNYAKNKYEVIVVDGGSKDNTVDLVRKFNLIRLKDKNISYSRNLGASKAKGEYLVFIDSDCLVSSNILRHAEKNLKEYDCVGSFYKADKNAGWVARTWLLIERKKKGLVDWIPGGTLIVKKRIFDEISGFDIRLKTQEDVDFCYRLKKKGCMIFNEPSIASVHTGQADNLKDFFWKELWRGRGFIKGILHHGLIKEELPSTILIFYHLLALFFLIFSLFLNYFILFLALIFLLLPSFLMAFRKAIQTKKIKFFFKFFILVFLYQVARVFSLLISF